MLLSELTIIYLATAAPFGVARFVELADDRADAVVECGDHGGINSPAVIAAGDSDHSTQILV